MKSTLRKLLWPLFSFSTFSVLIMGTARPAHAWFEVCNQSTQQADVAFAYLDISDSRPIDIFGTRPPAAQRGWISEGWWTLKSGQCARVYPHELRVRNSYYYVYAKGKNGGIWSGKKSFCVTGSAFTLGAANQRCGGNGYWKNFNEVFTGNSRNYTYRLTE